MVEVTGIEPVSEGNAPEASPSAFHVLTFPPEDAHEQAASFSSFIFSVP